MSNDVIIAINRDLYPKAYGYQTGWLDEITKKFGEIGKIWKDRGYFVSNYDGQYCPSVGQDSYCILGADDKNKQSEEILEVPMRNFKTLNKFRKFIEGKILHKPYSWVLDDLNPKTTYDEKITKKIDYTINSLKGLLIKHGYKEHSGDYQERLAIALMWFVAMPEVDSAQKAKDKSGSIEEKPEYAMLMEKQLHKIWLDKFAIQLSQQGGLRVKESDENEYSTLEVLNAKIGEKKGKCTEMSRVLFGILRRAGLKPESYMVRLTVSDVENMGLPPKLEKHSLENVAKLVEESPDFNHMCVGVRIGGKLRLLDPMYFQEDAIYQEYVHLPPRQFFSMEAVNRGEKYYASGNFQQSKDEYMFAVAMDPLNPRAYASLAALDYYEAHLPGNNKEEFLNKAILSYSKALEIYPPFIQARSDRGIVYLMKGKIEKALDDFSSFLKLKGDMYDKVYVVLQKYYLDKWKHSTKVNISDDKLKLSMAQCEAHIKGAGALWRANYTEQAYKELEAALHAVQEYKVSVNLEDRDDILKDIFSTLPAEMTEDAKAGELKKEIKKAFPGGK